MELKQKIKEIENRSAYSASFPESTNEQQANLSKIKESLASLESLVAYRSTASNKFLLKAHKLLAKHAKILLDQPLPCSSKGKLTVGIKKMSQTLTSIENLLLGPKNSQETIEEPEDFSDIYKNALEKMKNQTILLREKLQELENGDGLKKIIEDQDIKIQLLAKEKDLLKSHISHLQNSLRDQCEVIENLKILMRTQKNSNEHSLNSSPEKDEKGFRSFIDHDEKDLQAEIANLDSEIQLLQHSLKRALVNH